MSTSEDLLARALSRPTRRSGPHPAPGSVFVAATLAMVPVVVGLAWSLAPGGAAVLSGLLFAAAMAWATRALRASYPHPQLGACNIVTMARAGLAAVLTVPVLNPGVSETAPWPLFALAAVALALDGVDGWLARRAGLTSGFGARFDMEVDAALAAILALIQIRVGLGDEAPWQIVGLLVLGVSRYVFVAAGRAFPWLALPLPPRFGRKVVCVVQIGTLTALLMPVIPAALGLAALATAALSVLWSFGRDVLWLWRRRPGDRR